MEWNMANAFKAYKDIDSKLVMNLAVSNIEGVANGLGASDKGNASSSSKTRKKSMMSVYLKYFETAPDGKTRRCQFCGQSYSIATATDDVLKAIKPVINKAWEIALELNASKEMSEDITQMAMAYQEGNWIFPLDTSTRWSGIYQMLDIVCKPGKFIYAKIRGSKLLSGNSEKKAASVIYSYDESFYKTTNDMCTSKFPTIGIVLFFMDHISDTIAAYKESRQCLDWLKHPLKEMSRKSREYSSQVCNIFTYMTAIFDPRIKVDLLPESLNAENYLEEARNHFNYEILLINPFSIHV